MTNFLYFLYADLTDFRVRFVIHIGYTSSEKAVEV